MKKKRLVIRALKRRLGQFTRSKERSAVYFPKFVFSSQFGDLPMPTKKNSKQTNKKAPVRGAAGGKGKQSQWSSNQGSNEPEENVEGPSRERDAFSGEEER